MQFVLMIEYIFALKNTFFSPSRESECSMTSPGHQIPGEVGSRDECQQLCTEEEVGLLLYFYLHGMYGGLH